VLQNKSDLMKTLNETFTDEEYESMLHVKKESGLNWHDFILTSCLTRKESEIDQNTSNEVQKQ